MCAAQEALSDGAARTLCAVAAAADLVDDSQQAAVHVDDAAVADEAGGDEQRQELQQEAGVAPLAALDRGAERAAQVLNDLAPALVVLGLALVARLRVAVACRRGVGAVPCVVAGAIAVHGRVVRSRGGLCALVDRIRKVQQ